MKAKFSIALASLLLASAPALAEHEDPDKVAGSVTVETEADTGFFGRTWRNIKGVFGGDDADEHYDSEHDKERHKAYKEREKDRQEADREWRKDREEHHREMDKAHAEADREHAKKERELAKEHDKKAREAMKKREEEARKAYE